MTFQSSLPAPATPTSRSLEPRPKKKKYKNGPAPKNVLWRLWNHFRSQEPSTLAASQKAPPNALKIKHRFYSVYRVVTSQTQSSLSAPTTTISRSLRPKKKTNYKIKWFFSVSRAVASQNSLPAPATTISKSLEPLTKKKRHFRPHEPSRLAV